MHDGALVITRELYRLADNCPSPNSTIELTIYRHQTGTMINGTSHYPGTAVMRDEITLYHVSKD